MELDTRPVWAPGESELNLAEDTIRLACGCRKHRRYMPLPAGGPYQQYEKSTGGSATNTSQSRRPPFWTLAALHRADSRCEPRGWALGSLGAPSRGGWSRCCSAGRPAWPFLGTGCWVLVGHRSVRGQQGSGCDEQGPGSSISYQRLGIKNTETLSARGPARFASLAIAQAWPCRDLRQG